MKYFKFKAQESHGYYDITKGDEIIVKSNKNVHSEHIRNRIMDGGETRDLLGCNVLTEITHIKNPTDSEINSTNEYLSYVLNNK